MSNLSRIIIASAAACVLSLGFLGALPYNRLPSPVAASIGPAAALAEESSWKDDFDSICGKTQDAMSLSPDELRALIKRCDELKVKLDALEGSAKKVATKRLQMCRDLYAYVLEQKEKK